MSSKATKYFHYDPTTGAITHPGYTPDGTIPANCIACTDAQAASPDQYQVDITTTPSTIIAAPASKILASAQSDQIALIRAAFNTASQAPVTDTGGMIWSGGESSGSAIYLACQLAQQNGQASVTLWDSSNTAQTMTVAQGMAVAAAIGAEYQTLYQKWQNLRAQIMAATAISAVQAITW